jgi:hypothetical protein
VRAITALVGALFASMVGAVHMLPRPLILTWFFFLIFLVVLDEYRRQRRWRLLLPLPLLMIVWANLHPAFISGMMLVGLYFVGAVLEKDARRSMELLGLLAALLIASFVNPVGAALFVHTVGFLQNRFLVDVTVEYQSPNFHLLSMWPFAALLLLSIAIIGRLGRRLSWTLLVVLIGWTAFALYAARNISLYALVAVFLLAPEADRLIAKMLPAAEHFLAHVDALDRVVNGWIWVPLVVMLLVGLESAGTKIDVRNMGNAFDPRVFPIAAVDSMTDSLPSGNMFNEFNWGGYLLYRLWPRKRVFIDGQQDFYGETLTREYLQVINAGPGWATILDRYNVRWVILSPTRALAARLDESPAWFRRYTDATAVVWVRR